MRAGGLTSSAALLLGSLLGLGCADPPPSPPPVDALEDARPFLSTYASLLAAGYDDSVSGATALNEALAPIARGEATEAQLELARRAWIAARPPYLETEVARFYGGPIDGEHGPEPRINGWPMDEAYLDYVRGEDGAPIASGLINHPELLPVIDADAASAANLEGGEENVATGYHAIEFLLWGQDVSPTGPGARPFGDFLEGPLATAAHGERRRALLGVLGGLLVRDLTSVRDAWTEGQPHNFRAAFLALPPRDAMRLVLLGMASLAGTELAGERLNVPYLTQEAEDEHSCFSDTTQSDQLHDAMGLRNVYLGRYQRLDGSEVSGPGLSGLVAARDAALDARARAQLDAVVAALEAVPSPFDQAILGADDAPGRVAVRRALRELRGLTATLVEIGDRLGIRLNLIA